MNIAYQTVIGDNGKPEAAIIPWEVFLQLQELVEDDTPTAEELEAIREAEADRKAGRTENFVSLEDLKTELNL